MTNIVKFPGSDKLERYRTDYVDRPMIHGPIPSKEDRRLHGPLLLGPWLFVAGLLMVFIGIAGAVKMFAT